MMKMLMCLLLGACIGWQGSEYNMSKYEPVTRSGIVEAGQGMDEVIGNINTT